MRFFEHFSMILGDFCGFLADFVKKMGTNNAKIREKRQQIAKKHQTIDQNFGRRRFKKNKIENHNLKTEISELLN